MKIYSPFSIEEDKKANIHNLLHCWEVLVVHPPWQPIKKQLEFCRAIEDKGHSLGCSIRTTVPHYPPGEISPPTAIPCKSE